MEKDLYQQTEQEDKSTQPSTSIPTTPEDNDSPDISVAVAFIEIDIGEDDKSPEISTAAPESGLDEDEIRFEGDLDTLLSGERQPVQSQITNTYAEVTSSTVPSSRIYEPEEDRPTLIPPKPVVMPTTEVGGNLEDVDDSEDTKPIPEELKHLAEYSNSTFCQLYAAALAKHQKAMMEYSQLKRKKIPEPPSFQKFYQMFLDSRRR